MDTQRLAYKSRFVIGVCHDLGGVLHVQYAAGVAESVRQQPAILQLVANNARNQTRPLGRGIVIATRDARTSGVHRTDGAIPWPPVHPFHVTIHVRSPEDIIHLIDAKDFLQFGLDVGRAFQRRRRIRDRPIRAKLRRRRHNPRVVQALPRPLDVRVVNQRLHDMGAAEICRPRRRVARARERVPGSAVQRGNRSPVPVPGPNNMVQGEVGNAKARPFAGGKARGRAALSQLTRQVVVYEFAAHFRARCARGFPRMARGRAPKERIQRGEGEEVSARGRGVAPDLCPEQTLALRLDACAAVDRAREWKRKLCRVAAQRAVHGVRHLGAVERDALCRVHDEGGVECFGLEANQRLPHTCELVCVRNERHFKSPQ